MDNQPPMRVRLVDIDVPFSSLVWLLVKLALAAIPAALIIGAISFGLLLALRGIHA